MLQYTGWDSLLENIQDDKRVSQLNYLRLIEIDVLLNNHDYQVDFFDKINPLFF